MLIAAIILWPLVTFVHPAWSAAQVGSVTQVEVKNEENAGYIQVTVDGIDERYDRVMLERDSKGKIHKRHVKRIWQAGPGESIVVRRSNWSTSTRSISIVVKYFRDDGHPMEVSEPKTFALDPASGVHKFKWNFHKSRADAH